jgi:hypothetical protein
MYDSKRSLGRIAKKAPAKAGVSEIIIPRMAAKLTPRRGFI